MRASDPGLAPSPPSSAPSSDPEVASALLEFLASPLECVPAAALSEYRQIYDDLRWASSDGGSAARASARAADEEEDGASAGPAWLPASFPTAALAPSCAAAAAPDEDGPPLEAAAVRAALLVNGVHFAEAELVAVLGAMDPARRGTIAFADFAACLHALSLQDQEVLPAWRYAVFPDSDFEGHGVARGCLLLRRRVHTALDNPQSSLSARLVAMVMLGAILASTVSFVLESFPEFKAADTEQDWFGIVERVTVSIFTVEYVLQLWSTPERLAVYACRFLSLVDLASIAPFYLELVLLSAHRAVAGLDSTGTGASVLRTIRLFRVFRLVKISHYVAWMRLFGATLRASRAALAMTTLIVLLSLLISASIEYYAERGEWDASRGLYVMANNATWFTSIPDAMWWATVSMTTTGYGDTYPITGPGKALATCVFLVGLLLFAIPISVISGAFHTEFVRMENRKRLRAEHESGGVGSVPGLERGVELRVQQEQGGEDAAEGAPPGEDAPLDSSSTSGGGGGSHWSSPFLQSSLRVVRLNRRRLMSALKQAELRNRESAIDGVRTFLADIAQHERERVAAVAAAPVPAAPQGGGQRRAAEGGEGLPGGMPQSRAGDDGGAERAAPLHTSPWHVGRGPPHHAMGGVAGGLDGLMSPVRVRRRNA